MYLHESKCKDGRIYLTFVEDYREGDKVKHKTLESSGYLDELEKVYDDPIAHFKAICDEANVAAKAERQSVQISIHPQQKIDKRAASRKIISSAVLLAFYSLLGIEQVIRNHFKTRKFDFDANAIMRLLVAERILSPGSKKSAWENKDNYIFSSEFSLDDVYRSLGALSQAQNKIVSAINRSIDKMDTRDTTFVFYDVTNHYFEIDDPDDEGGLRQKGLSKEHRKSPIVQMGLLQDSKGIPIGYKLFSGNTVSRQDHIEAHFLTCCVALCIQRIMQASCDGAYSAAVAAQELGAMCGTKLDGNWWIFDHRSDATDGLCGMAGIDLTRKNMQLKDIKAVLAQANRLSPSPNKKRYPKS